MLELLYQLESTQTLLLSVIAFLFASAAIVASYQKAAHFRTYTLIALTISCIIIAVQAEPIFEDLNSNHIYDKFFLNLSVELASAWIIYPLTIGLWYLSKNLVAPILACLILVWVVFSFLKPQYLYPLQQLDISISLIHDLVVNIKFEIISMTLMLIVLISWGALGAMFNLDYTDDLEPLQRFIVITSILIAIGAIGAALVIMRFQLPAYNPRIDNIHTSILGAILTGFIIGDWIGRDSYTFVIMACGILLVAFSLILQIDHPIWFDSNACIGVATELLGALIAGILLNRQWLWVTRRNFLT